MSEAASLPIEPAAIVAAIRAIDPSVRFVAPRVLRRVIKRDRNLTGALVQVPHRKTFVVDAKHLLLHVRKTEIFPETAAELPASVILLPYPEKRQILGRGREGCLLHWWRLLFHARIHQVLEAPESAARLSQACVRERVDRIGQTVFDEARRVLDQEHYFLPPRNEFAEYVEFAAVFFELRHFVPRLLERYFPVIEDAERVSRVLSLDVDGAALFQATRPEGAPDPVAWEDVGPPPRRSWNEPLAAPSRGLRARSPKAVRSLLLAAERSRERGNVVRAAILRQRAEADGRPLGEVAPAAEARCDLERLVLRLREALGLDRELGRQWLAALVKLLPQAAAGFRAPEARILYDLQKVCVDHERGIQAVDLIGAVLSLGRRTIRRALPFQREVMMTRHLRAAEKRVFSLRVSEPEIEQLEALLDDAEAAAEHHLRRRVRPAIASALDRVGLLARNAPERVARAKMEEELLDRIAARGFLTIGDLRDGVSRNQLKLEDCMGAADFWSADHLLSADRALSESLEGIYRRGEVYLRWLQRLSALSFGTRTGRFLTRYGAIPFGGAYLVLEGLQHMLVHPIGKLVGHDEASVRTSLSVLLLGIWFLGLVHVPRVRSVSAELFRGIGRGFKAVFWTFPRAVATWPPLRAVLDSVAVRTVGRYLFKPALLAGLVWLPVSFLRPAETALIGIGAGLFFGFNIFLNSPLGTLVEERVLDLLARGWDQVKTRLVVSLVRFVIHAFKRATEALEQFLYGVDEWLRFRQGQSRLALLAKGAAGSVWRGLNYVIRLYVTLLIEPQVNPIKHFPVVTVTHKMIIPLYPELFAFFKILFRPLGTLLGDFLAGATLFLLPGLFGFMVWEFKENWRLYAASRSPALKPTLVGHHGETLLRLMKPGFHSGTLPKLYAKLRKVERKRRVLWQPGARRRLLMAITHVEHAVAHFVERELVTLLRESSALGGRHFEVGRVEAGSNRLRISIVDRADPARPFVFAFDEQSGFVVAGILESGFVADLDPGARRVFRDALAGLYKSGGVDLVREEVEQALGAPTPPYDIADGGLVVWPGPGFETQRVLALAPRAAAEGEDARALLFGPRPVGWYEWVGTWEREERGEPGRPILAGAALIKDDTVVQAP